MSLENIDPFIRIAAFIVGAACLLSPSFVFLRKHTLNISALAIVLPGTILCSAGVWSTVTIEMPGGYKTQLAEFEEIINSTNEKIVEISAQISESEKRGQLAVSEEANRLRSDLIASLSDNAATRGLTTGAQASSWAEIVNELVPEVPIVEFLAAGENVKSLLSGSVKSVVKNETIGTYSIVVENKQGINETVTNLAETSLSAGDEVSVEQILGIAAPGTYQTETIRTIKPSGMKMMDTRAQFHKQ